MKKFASILLALLLLAAIPMQALADEVVAPEAPVIVSESQDQDPFYGESVTLTVNATCEEGAVLTYQWHVADAKDMALIRAIEGAEGNSYTISASAQDIGKTKYYCLGVWSNAGGVQTGPVYSKLIRVTVHSVGDSIEILQKPTKLEYTQGETLDLTGLRVRIYTADGYFDSEDGENLEISAEDDFEEFDPA